MARILILEDHFIQAADTERILLQAGHGAARLLVPAPEEALNVPVPCDFHDGDIIRFGRRRGLVAPGTRGERTQDAGFQIAANPIDDVRELDRMGDVVHEVDQGADADGEQRDRANQRHPRHEGRCRRLADRAEQSGACKENECGNTALKHES